MLPALIKDLNNKGPCEATEGLQKIIPKDIGVYIWSAKMDGQLVYAGKATGRNGLYRRILKQHLNPRYLLTDQDKWHYEKDAFQIAHHAILNGKPAIDKSAFRKNLGRVHGLRPGEETVNFIKSNFLLRFVVVSSRESALLIEKEIIRLYAPKYNISGNNPQIFVAL